MASPFAASTGTYVPPMPDRAWLTANSGDPAAANIRTRIGDIGKAYWFGPHNDGAQVAALAADAKARGELFVFVPYALPSRDQGSSIGTVADYAAYSQTMAAAIGDTPTVVILEPDSVLIWSDTATRVASLQAALDAYGALPNTWTYLDGTDGRWQDPAAVASRLNQIMAGGHPVHGIAYNVSNYNTPAQIDTYAGQMQPLLDRPNLPYVLDCSRNGLGPNAAGDWCNAGGRGLGHPPTFTPPTGNAEAWLWVKTPGTSDGYCGAYPSVPSGQFSRQMAVDLIANSPYSGDEVPDDGDPPSGGGGVASMPTIREVATRRGATASGTAAVSAEAGDLLVAVCSSEASAPSVSGGGTWTQRVLSNAFGWGMYVAIHTAPVTSSGAKTVTVSGSGAVLMTLYAVTGVDSVGGTSVGSGPNNETSQTIASLTTTQDGVLLLAGWAKLSGSSSPGTYVAPPQMTARANFGRDTGYAAMLSASEERPTAGATGTRTATGTLNAAAWHGAMIALAGVAVTTIPITVRAARAATHTSHPQTTQHSTDLDVQNAQAASAGTRPQLGQAQPVGVYGAHTTTSATGGVELAQTHPLTVHTVQAAPAATSPELDQHTLVEVWAARATPLLEQVTVGQRTPVQVAGVRSATSTTSPVLVTAGVKDARAETSATSPALTQHHGPITVHDAVATPGLDRPELDQTGVLTVRNVRAATEYDWIKLAQRSALTLPAVQAATAAGQPTLAQHTTLTVADTRTASSSGLPLVAAEQDLVIYMAQAQPRLDTPLLRAPIIIEVRPARAATVVDGPELAQHAPLHGVSGLRLTTRATRPRARAAQDLRVYNAETTTLAGRATVTQLSVLHAWGSRSTTAVTELSLVPPPATAAQNPGTVMVLPDFGAVLIELVSLPHTVTVDINSNIHVFEARGTVLETF